MNGRMEGWIDEISLIQSVICTIQNLKIEKFEIGKRKVARA